MSKPDLLAIRKAGKAKTLTEEERRHVARRCRENVTGSDEDADLQEVA